MTVSPLAPTLRRLPPRRACAAALAMCLSPAAASPAPSCPDGAGGPEPAYAPLGAPPRTAAWRDLVALPDACLTMLETSAPLTVALAGRFTHVGTIDDLAARLGAVSATAGLPYWSVTDRDWKPLVTEAAALTGPDASDARPDFDAAEVLGGDTLHFAQNDSRSWGMNVYRLRTLDASPDRLVAGIDNVSSIRLGPVTLFEPHAVTATHFVERLEGTTWGYYGLSVIRDSAFEARERSLINRQAALYRLLIGEAPDGAPPLAP